MENDIFISYSRLDNHSVVEGEQGWIDRFYFALRSRLAQFLGRDAKIFFDMESIYNNEINRTIREKIVESSIFVPILSPGYLKSEFCHAELDFFLKKKMKRRDSPSGIFPILKSPIDENPEQLENFLKYQFFSFDQEGKLFIFDPRLGPEAEAKFYLKIDDLAYRIAEYISEFKQTENSPSQDHVPIIPDSDDFDVFLCHNTIDKPDVKQIGKRLIEKGLKPWLDEWELRPGYSWQEILEKQIPKIKAAAVFVGKDGIGPWQRRELNAFLREFVKRECPVIPVFLSSAHTQPDDVPIFLNDLTWVDFRTNDPDPFGRLIWGITGKRIDNLY